MRNFRKKARAWWASAVIAVGLALIIFGIYLTKHRGNNGRGARFACRFWFFCSGFRLKRVGTFDRSAQLIVMNHQSIADIMCLEGYHPQNICWIAKHELGKIFFYGHALKGPEMILVDRENANGLKKMLKEAKNRIKNGRTLVIFPEGTRGNGGKNFLDFKPGAKVLAEFFRLKIQPVVLVGTRKMYDTSIMKSEASEAKMIILPAYEPDFADEKWFEKLRENMHETYLAHYSRS